MSNISIFFKIWNYLFEPTIIPEIDIQKYQDTNNSQYLIVKALAALNENDKTLSHWTKKLEYNPNRIESKKKIYEKLNKYGKYYLD